jgi:hypothetical protein
VDQVEKDGEDTLAALKFEQPADRWEFYIGRVLHGRLEEQQQSPAGQAGYGVSGGKRRFVEMKELHLAGEQASLLLTSLGSFGTLQDLVNAYRLKGQVRIIVARIHPYYLCFAEQGSLTNTISTIMLSQILFSTLKLCLVRSRQCRSRL